MFDIFGQLQLLLKKSSAVIDNNVFVLHYKATVFILVLFSIIVGTSKYFGDPIDCTQSAASIEKVADKYCWFNVYIIVPREEGGSYEEDDSILPAFAHFKNRKHYKNHDTYKVNDLYIYQWFEFILFLQAVAFFIPRYLWRYCWESGRIKALTENCAKVTLKKEEDDKQKYSEIVTYFARNRHDHLEYSLKFVVCEILNFANVLTQFVMLSKVLKASGPELLEELKYSESNYDWRSPLYRVFPNVARCDVPTPGGSGTTYLYEYCVLPIMIFVAKLYILLWFYFLFLTIVSGLALVYRVLTIVSPQIRSFLLKRQAKCSDSTIDTLRVHLGYGDWFMLYQVGKNMDPFCFKDLLHEFWVKLAKGRNSIINLPKSNSDNRLYPGDFNPMRQNSLGESGKEKEGFK